MATVEWVKHLEAENARLKGTLKQVARHVGSMLPERLDPVNRQLHEKALNVLYQALD